MKNDCPVNEGSYSFRTFAWKAKGNLKCYIYWFCTSLWNLWFFNSVGNIQVDLSNDLESGVKKIERDKNSVLCVHCLYDSSIWTFLSFTGTERHWIRDLDKLLHHFLFEWILPSYISSIKLSVMEVMEPRVFIG